MIKTLTMYRIVFFLAAYLAVGTVLVPTAFAASNALSNVNVVDIPKGYELEIHHENPMRYAGHSPETDGNKLVINFTQGLPITHEDDEAILNWGSAFDVPVKDIRLDDLTSESPVMVVKFTKDVKFAVKNTRDNRMTIITIETDRPLFTGPMPVRDQEGVTNLVIALKPIDPDMEVLLDRASNHLLDKEYRQAVQVFIRIRERGNEEIQPQIQELIGLTREYLDQNAQAIAEYQTYLEKYPNSAEAPRIQQRLNALLTAATFPKEKRKSAQTPDATEWKKQVFGSVAQTYFYNERNTPSDDRIVQRSALNNYVSVIGRASNDEYDIRARFSGVYQKDFEFDGDQDVTNPTSVSVEARHKKLGLYGRLGRQTRASGGVLGRFDGAHVAYEVNPSITVNGVFGYPIDYLRKDAINTDQQFFGTSIDIGDIWKGWEFSGFFITQDYLDLKDREAIGAEVRYFDTQKNFFTLVDYDVEYEHLNIFMGNGRWAFTPKTAASASFNYRSNPILISTGALQGQGVNYFEELTQFYSSREIFELVAARIADYTTGTLGVSHKLNDRWTLDGELYFSQYGGTEATQGIDAILKTDPEIYYTTRVSTTHLFFDNDSTIFQLRFADTDRHQTSSFGMNWRYNITPELRINPRIRFDYRSSNTNDDERLYTRYDLSLDYRVRRQLSLELDLGYDWQQEETPFIEFQSTGLYLSAGYRWQF